MEKQDMRVLTLDPYQHGVVINGHLRQGEIQSPGRCGKGYGRCVFSVGRLIIRGKYAKGGEEIPRPVFMPVCTFAANTDFW